MIVLVWRFTLTSSLTLQRHRKKPQHSLQFLFTKQRSVAEAFRGVPLLRVRALRHAIQDKHAQKSFFACGDVQSACAVEGSNGALLCGTTETARRLVCMNKEKHAHISEHFVGLNHAPRVLYLLAGDVVERAVKC